MTKEDPDRLPFAALLQRALGHQQMHVHMETQVAPKRVARGDDPGQQFMGLAEVPVAVPHRSRMAHGGQQVSPLIQQLPQLPRHTEHHVPVRALNHPGLQTLHLPRNTQPAARRTEPALAREAHHLALSAPLAPELNVAARRRPARHHLRKLMPHRLPQAPRQPPTETSQRSGPMVTHYLVHHRPAGTHPNYYAVTAKEPCRSRGERTSPRMISDEHFLSVY